MVEPVKDEISGEIKSGELLYNEQTAYPENIDEDGSDNNKEGEKEISNTENINVEVTDSNTILGEGSFGKVVLVEDYQYKVKFAVKLIPSYCGSSYVDSFKREFQVLNQISHPNVVKFYKDTEYIFRDEKYYGLVLEYAENGTVLDDIIKNVVFQKK